MLIIISNEGGDFILIKRMILFILISILILSGCSSSASAYGKAPKNVDQKLWDMAHEVIDIIDERAIAKEYISDEENEIIRKFVDTYYIDKETFVKNLGKKYTFQEEQIILRVILAITQFEVNMFDLELNNRDRLSQTLVAVKKFRDLTEEMKSDERDWDKTSLKK